MAFSAGLVWQIQNGGSDSNAGAFRGGAALSTPSAPTVAISSGGSITNATYYVVVTLTDGNGETAKSAESPVTSSGANHTITVTAPTNPVSQGATWNVYFGTTSGGPYFAGTAGTSLLFTANYAITSTPPTTGTQAPGVDYSQQNSAQVAYTDLVIGNPTTTNLTSAANPFTPAHVGNVLNVTSGTNFSVQRLEITGVTAAGVATVDKTAGTAGATGGTGNLGGALASPALACGLTAAGNGVFVKYSATPYSCSASTGVANGSISSNNPGWIIGYNTTRSIGNSDSLRPTLQASANSVTLVASTRNSGRFANFILDGNAKTTVTGSMYVGSTAQTRNVKALSCATGFNVNNGTCSLLGCEANTCTTGFTGAGGILYLDCVAISCATAGFTVNASQGNCVNCIATACGTNFTVTGSLAHFLNCTARGSTSGAGFQINSSGPWGAFVNCLSYGNNTYGFASTAGVAASGYLLNCAAGGNTLAEVQYGSSLPASLLVGFVTLTANPFTNSAGNDFSLNNTAGGGAALRAAGFPSSFPGLSTLNYPDVGAAQTQSTVTASGGGKILTSSIIQPMGVA